MGLFPCFRGINRITEYTGFSCRGELKDCKSPKQGTPRGRPGSFVLFIDLGFQRYPDAFLIMIVISAHILIYIPVVAVHTRNKTTMFANFPDPNSRLI